MALARMRLKLILKLRIYWPNSLEGTIHDYQALRI